MMTPRLALLISLAGFGCSSVDVEDIRRHQRQWRDADIQDYVFVSYRGCFCGTTDIDGIRHEVRDGDVVASVGVSTGLPLDHEAQTIDDIFDEAIASAREDPDEFRITYDAAHGFIQSVEIDPDSNAEDDGFILEVRCFSTDIENGCPVTTLSEAECAAADGTPTDVAESDPWQTCEYEYPGPIGRITETDQVCCTGR